MIRRVGVGCHGLVRVAVESDVAPRPPCNVSSMRPARGVVRTTKVVGRSRVTTASVPLLQSEAMSPSATNHQLHVFSSFENWHRNRFLMKHCEPEACLSVALLLSGGVDSSVALALLKAAGHKVTAFYLKIWFQEDFENFWSACPWEEDIRYATQVCDRLHVPFEVVPLSHEYWELVTSTTVAEIKAGRTPNPDMLCNSRVKFGAFAEFLQKRNRKFDRIASGHYAQRIRIKETTGEESVHLALSADSIKDQTYFLAQLTTGQLSKCMFPLGGLRKSDVRQLAAAADLPTFKRKDSQGICFLGKVRFSEFVERHLGTWPGLILEETTRRHLGFHNGYWFHTIGQRSGLKMSGGPWYVTRKDVRWNVIYVEHMEEDPVGKHDTFYCHDMNWFNGPPVHSDLQCKVRHGEHLGRCRVVLRGDSWLVRLKHPDQGLASGQYAVFYHEGICLGSGSMDTSYVIES